MNTRALLSKANHPTSTDIDVVFNIPIYGCQIQEVVFKCLSLVYRESLPPKKPLNE